MASQEVDMSTTSVDGVLFSGSGDPRGGGGQQAAPRRNVFQRGGDAVRRLAARFTRR